MAFAEHNIRLLIVAGFSYPSNNAASSRISSLVNGLLRNGISPSVISPLSLSRSKRILGQKNEQQNNVLQVLPVIPFSNVFANLVNLIVSFFFGLAFLAFQSYDLLLLSVPPYESALGFSIAFLLRASLFGRGAVLVYDCRDLHIDESGYKSFSRGVYAIDKYLFRPLFSLSSIVLRQGDTIVCTTEYQRNCLVKAGFQKNRIKIIANGADTQLFRPFSELKKNASRLEQGIPPHSFVLIVVSAGSWTYYRLEPIIAALKTLIDSKTFDKDNLRLLVVGKQTRELRAFHKLAMNLGVAESILFMGEISAIDIPAVLGLADVGVVPYADVDFVKNTLPVKLFEYCSCGLPLIVTAPDGSLVEDLVLRNRLGLVCRSSDVKCLAGAIASLHRDPELRKLGETCRKAIIEQYDRRMLSQKYVNLLKEISARRDGSCRCVNGV